MKTARRKMEDAISTDIDNGKVTITWDTEKDKFYIVSNDYRKHIFIHGNELYFICNQFLVKLQKTLTRKILKLL